MAVSSGEEPHRRPQAHEEEPRPVTNDEDGRSWPEENLPDPAAGSDAAYARSVLLGSIQAANDGAGSRRTV